MKTSFNTYNDKNKGFWINEAYFELISHFVVLAFKEKELEKNPDWYLSVYDDFLDISSGHVQGYAYLTLKDACPSCNPILEHFGITDTK